MRPRRPTIRLYFDSQRLLACGVMLVYVFSAAGLPLPAPVAKDLSAPFPCQYRRCGCVSAEQCLRKCCCFSEHEKQAWFAARKLTPALDKAHSCCSKQPQSVVKVQTTGDGPTDSHGANWIDPTDVRQCQGQLSLWLSIGIAVVPPSNTHAPEFELLPERVCTLRATAPTSPGHVPLVPPPQV